MKNEIKKFITQEVPSNLDNWHIRLPDEEDQKTVLQNFFRSGAKTKSDFARDRLLDKSFTVVYIDDGWKEYQRKLQDILYQIRKIGINLNQVVGKLNSYTTLPRQPKLFVEIRDLIDEACYHEQTLIDLTKESRSNLLDKN